jgi:hypothetical protein
MGDGWFSTAPVFVRCNCSRDSAKLAKLSLIRRPPMADRDWEEEKRSVLGRLFSGAFGRRQTSEEEMNSDIHWLGTVNKHLDEDDDDDD